MIIEGFRTGLPREPNIAGIRNVLRTLNYTEIPDMASERDLEPWGDYPVSRLMGTVKAYWGPSRAIEASWASLGRPMLLWIGSCEVLGKVPSMLRPF